MNILHEQLAVAREKKDEALVSRIIDQILYIANHRLDRPDSKYEIYFSPKPKPQPAEPKAEKPKRYVAKRRYIFKNKKGGAARTNLIQDAKKALTPKG